MICVGRYETKDTNPLRCGVAGHGDSGGPLACKSSKTNKTIIRGVLQGGSSCKNGKYTPSLYPNVGSQLDFIMQTISETRHSSLIVIFYLVLLPPRRPASDGIPGIRAETNDNNINHGIIAPKRGEGGRFGAARPGCSGIIIDFTFTVSGHLNA